jgi:RNA polymerase sigma-70 factor (ECF subfamily)
MSYDGFVEDRGAGAMSKFESRGAPGRRLKAERPANNPGGGSVNCERQLPKASEEVSEDIARRMVEILPRLRRFTSSLTRDGSLSEDLVQETYARALARLDQWRPDSRLDSWMYRIAQNLWIDQLRTEKARGEVVDISTLENLLGCDGRSVIESRLTLFEFTQRLAQLPAHQRTLLRLVCVDGLTYVEAAEALHSPVGTIMSRLARARRALNQTVGVKPPAVGRRSRAHLCH